MDSDFIFPAKERPTAPSYPPHIQLKFAVDTDFENGIYIIPQMTTL